MQWFQLQVLGLLFCTPSASGFLCQGLFPTNDVTISESAVIARSEKRLLRTNCISIVGVDEGFKSDGDETSIKSLAIEIIGSLCDKDRSARIGVLDLICGTDILWESLIEEADKSALELQITGVVDSPERAKEFSKIASILQERCRKSGHQIKVVRSNIMRYMKSLDESSNFDCALLNHSVGDRSFALRDILVEVLGSGIDTVCITRLNGVGSEGLKVLPRNSIELAIETHRLPLMLSKMVNDLFYFVSMKKCRGNTLQHIHRYKGTVSNGYGRGGKELGVPTANLPASLFQQALVDVETGVYFGWAAIEDIPGRTFKAVVNVGYSPTFKGRENKEKVIEAHLILKEGEELHDFYGSVLRLKLLGYLRPECKFDDFQALIAQINADVNDSDIILDTAPFQDLRVDCFFDTSKNWIGSGGGDKDASWEFSLMSTELENLSRKMM